MGQALNVVRPANLARTALESKDRKVEEVQQMSLAEHSRRPDEEHSDSRFGEEEDWELPVNALEDSLQAEREEESC